MGRRSKANPVDWEAVEKDYRAGIMTLRTMAEAHKVSHVAIQNRAKKDGWTRDLSAKIKQKAQEKLTATVLTAEITAEQKATERQIVEIGAETLAGVVRRHIRQIGAAQKITDTLLAELGAITDRIDLIEQMESALAQDGADPLDLAPIREAIRRATSIPGRAGTLKTLSEAMKNLIVLERQAFRVDESPDEGPAATSSGNITAGVAAAMDVIRAKMAAARVPAE